MNVASGLKATGNKHKGWQSGEGESDNGNQLYLHYKYDSSNLSFSNMSIIF
jgi:hypothetical protein